MKMISWILSYFKRYFYFYSRRSTAKATGWACRSRSRQDACLGSFDDRRQTEKIEEWVECAWRFKSARCREWWWVNLPWEVRCTWPFSFLRRTSIAPVVRLQGRHRTATLHDALPKGSRKSDKLSAKPGLQESIWTKKWKKQMGLGFLYHPDSCARRDEIAVDL